MDIVQGLLELGALDGRSARPLHQVYVLTKFMLEAGDLLGIRVIDHLVVAGNSYRSIRRGGGKLSAPRSAGVWTSPRIGLRAECAGGNLAAERR